MNELELERFARLFAQFSHDVQKNSAAHGFWDLQEVGQGPHPVTIPRNKAEMIALMHSELSEALEALRKDPSAPDHHVPELTNLEIELADCVIRIMDFGAGFGLRLADAILAKHEYNKSRPYKHGKAF